MLGVKCKSLDGTRVHEFLPPSTFLPFTIGTHISRTSRTLTRLRRFLNASSLADNWGAALAGIGGLSAEDVMVEEAMGSLSPARLSVSVSLSVLSIAAGILTASAVFCLPFTTSLAFCFSFSSSRILTSLISFENQLIDHHNAPERNDRTTKWALWVTIKRTKSRNSREAKVAFVATNEAWPWSEDTRPKVFKKGRHARFRERRTVTTNPFDL